MYKLTGCEIPIIKFFKYWLAKMQNGKLVKAYTLGKNLKRTNGECCLGRWPIEYSIEYLVNINSWYQLVTSAFYKRLEATLGPSKDM